MVYTELTKIAMKIAYEAHHGQTDKNDIPYIYHPIHLAEQMKDEETICVALLHDVVEDTDITFDDLEKNGFTNGIIAALKLLTHDDAEPYLEYVARIKNNEIARQVKIADLRHNSDLSRLDNIDEIVIQRKKKYEKALEILLNS